jgi:xylulose-5-phosphate/fructose-6-phosphate phosphoketolase
MRWRRYKCVLVVLRITTSWAVAYGYTPHSLEGSEAERDATMPFDMCVVNDLARSHGVGDVIDRLPRLGAYFKQAICHKLIEHKEYIVLHGGDLPEIAGGGLRHATALGALRSTEADSV